MLLGLVAKKPSKQDRREIYFDVSQSDFNMCSSIKHGLKRKFWRQKLGADGKRLIGSDFEKLR